MSGPPAKKSWSSDSDPQDWSSSWSWESCGLRDESSSLLLWSESLGVSSPCSLVWVLRKRLETVGAVVALRRSGLGASRSEVGITGGLRLSLARMYWDCLRSLARSTFALARLNSFAFSSSLCD